MAFDRVYYHPLVPTVAGREHSKEAATLRLAKLFFEHGGRVLWGGGHDCTASCQWYFDGDEVALCLASGSIHRCGGSSCPYTVQDPRSHMFTCCRTGRVVCADRVSSFDDRQHTFADRDASRSDAVEAVDRGDAVDEVDHDHADEPGLFGAEAGAPGVPAPRAPRKPARGRPRNKPGEWDECRALVEACLMRGCRCAIEDIPLPVRVLVVGVAHRLWRLVVGVRAAGTRGTYTIQRHCIVVVAEIASSSRKHVLGLTDKLNNPILPSVSFFSANPYLVQQNEGGATTHNTTTGNTHLRRLLYAVPPEELLRYQKDLRALKAAYDGHQEA